MRQAVYPFSALVGLEPLRLALLLAAVDWRLGVLAFGEKGCGKSTAARALAGLLPGEAPFVEVPVGSTEERVLGGIDLEAAFAGQARLKPGLVQSAHGGVLYLDEVNLLPAPLADALLDVLATGCYRLERDGFSLVAQAEFILLGTMNPEEGSLRPQLLDRFALAVEVHPPADPELRMRIVQLREEFDRNPAAFCARFASEQEALRQQVERARQLLPRVRTPEAVSRRIAALAAGHGVLSLRADLALHRACRALAALEQREEVAIDDAERVAPLVLRHRQRHAAQRQPPPPAPAPGPAGAEDRPGGAASPPERLFLPDPVEAPALRASSLEDRRPARTPPAPDAPTGRSAEPSVRPQPVDIFASLRRSAVATARPRLDENHLVARAGSGSAPACLLFAVDASGSLAARRRISVVKGLALGFLQQSAQQGWEVSVIAFRGSAAQILLPPCREPELARQRLAYVPCGGRTPLAHALQLAAGYPQDRLCFLLFTDGQANVALSDGDPWQDALQQAGRIRCPALVVDCSLEGNPRLAELASAMQARLLRLEDCTEAAVVELAARCQASSHRQG